ncbi:TetR/AcrR family transcriptional regulator [Mycobacterium sp. CBMA293]|uniref:TetR/AcrR family transcriptional regulator n=1 Tax=unclassified Mycolicibacterium TaxID=2636767 RepID=UPI0012DD4C12|nr:MULTISPECIES: TetR/AcrR family transcriptional regulator [unclassified Mycolicibacterium]MUL49676.1 TetR/AcrR family transcriptional regulator [Mycolicibacterium sp. CBMA 360]MUL60111.1 TetR/AcrR family transcriptional regulator [Mycolicibacterium sp. CBMA 335]MUL72898.1 TetR/AcrR family transcriptional regulator [Mycolicibacterium sp. CBMA 311]MUL96127.1 TetR/AcrR family transcriptional regulator [Mycolicibacterium sp. CBMA 230]MUM08142.1 TetR family transcriptional regulator [Mycolicibact
MPTVGRYAKGEAKRAEIKDAALAVLERDGEAGASMRVIAKEANISLAGLMHYFPTRDALLTELQSDGDAKFEEWYRNSATSIDPGEILAQAMVDKAAKPGSGTVYLSLAAAAAIDPSHPAAEYLRQRYERMRDTVADYVRGRQAAGTVPAGVDAEFAAAALIAAADGIQIQWMSDPSIDMGAHVRAVWERLLT